PPKIVPERRGRRSRPVQEAAELPRAAGTSANESVTSTVALGGAPTKPDSNAIDGLANKDTRSATLADNLGAPVLSKRAPAVSKKKLAPPTRWNVSPEGALLRSTNAGKDWQPI